MNDWQPVVGWEGVYEITMDARVRRCGGKELRPWPHDQGYPIVRLSDAKTGRRMMARLHRLVAEAFIPNPKGLPFVNHIDNNPANCAASNLEWCTQKENLGHARRQGRMPDDYWIGKRSPNAMLSDAQVKTIREMHASGRYSWQALADEFEISKRAIGRIIKRETYPDV